MAPSRVLKSLNKGPGSRRFVFKTFSQRVEEVDVDVFRSLAPVKFEPTSGSSFFHENLVRWRELNCAADFNNVYHELLPLVQTLPQLLLHKDTIMKSLLSRVRMSAMLSLEPILSLIALLSRDLQGEFIPYLGKCVDTCADLLKTGGDQEPELLEQVFVSISYIIKYLMKILTKDTLLLLRATKSLRFYHRSYVQDFIAESVSFLLRKAPPKQLIKGVRRLFTEVDSDPCETKISSCCSLLYNTLRGPSSGLHSQAEPFLQLLLDRSILSGGRKKYNGETGEIAVDIVARTFLLVCKDVKRDKIELLWECLLDNIHQELATSPNEDLIKTESNELIVRSRVKRRDFQSNGVSNSTHLVSDTSEQDTSITSPDKNLSEECNAGPKPVHSEAGVGETIMTEDNDDINTEKNQIHLVHLLTLLNTVLEYAKGSRVNDYVPLFSLVPELLSPEVGKETLSSVKCFAGPIPPTKVLHDPSVKLLAEVLRFLLALAKSHTQVAGASRGPGVIIKAAPKWVLAFECKNVDCLIPFLGGLIQLDVMLLQTFAPYLLRALDRLVEEYPENIFPLLLDLSQKLDLKALLGPETARLKSFVIRLIQEAISALRSKNTSSELSDGFESPGVDPAMLLAALQCIPMMIAPGEDSGSLAWEYVCAVENSSLSDADGSEEPENLNKVRELLLATALSAHLQMLASGDPKILLQHTEKYLDLAVKYKNSSHVLTAVADLLEISNTALASEDSRTNLSVLLGDFAANLGDPHKDLRIATLRILAHHESLVTWDKDTELAPAKRRKRLDGQQHEIDTSSSSHVFSNLLAVESTPLTIESCRKSTLLITAIKVEACSGRMPNSYILPVANHLSGLLYNRFASLWDPVIESLAGMVDAHGITLWDFLLHRLEASHNMFLFEKIDEGKGGTVEDMETSQRDIWCRFDSRMVEKNDSTRVGSLLSLQLKTLQRVPRIAEARSRELIPLFLTFVGYSQSEGERLESTVGKGKEWKASLKEWLNLIRVMKNARALYCGPVVKEILLNRFLGDSEPAVQEVTLDCLLNWKDKYLTSYEVHLKNLVSSKAIREELTTWNVSKESHEIRDDDRQPLLAVVLMLLFPRIMRRTVKSLRKSGVGVQRNAVLSFLGHLEPTELAPLFCQLLKPLQNVFASDNGVAKASNSSWIIMTKEGADSRFIEQVCTEAVVTLPYKRKLGFLHMVLASLDNFNAHQLGPYIHALLAIVLRLMEACAFDSSAQEIGTLVMEDEIASQNFETEDVELKFLSQGDSERLIHESYDEPRLSAEDFGMTDQDGDGIVKESEEGDALDNDNSRTVKGRGSVREVKTLCLRVIGAVVKRFDNIVFSYVYWDIFFSAVRQSIARFVEENSSSTSPGALMQCFMMMSQRMELAPLLSRDPVLVPNLLSILAVRGTSSQVVAAVLNIVENILDLVSGNSQDDRMEAVRGILSPHLPVLLSSFRDSLTFHRESTSEKRLLKRELKILTRLSTFIVDSDLAAKLVRVLLPMLKVKKKVDQGVCLEVLQLLEGMGATLKIDMSNKCLTALAPLLVSISNRAIRVAVSQTLRALANVDHSLLIVAELLVDLNSMSSTDIDEFDYTRRLAAYDRMSKSLFTQLTQIQALLVLSSVIFDMGSEDMSIRHRASDCLQEFVRFAGSLPDEILEEHLKVSLEKDAFKFEGASEENDAGITDITEEETEVAKVDSKSLKSLVPTFFLAHVRNAMRFEVLVVRREWVLLLREMILNFTDVPTLTEYQGLISKDVEADFFFNIVHLQVHRRMRAMGKFRTLCSASYFSQGALARIFVPLFMNSLHEAKGDKEDNLVSTAVDTLACIATQVPWEPYFTLLMRCFRMMGSKPELQKVYVRVACAILDKFHFFLPSLKGSDDSFPLSNGDEKQEVVSFSGNGAIELTSWKGPGQLPAEVLKPLRERVLPEIRRLMVSKGDIVSTPVALTQVKILKLMPTDIIEVELPQVVRTIINLLKSRRQAIRDEARTALVALTETLGAHYLRFIVEVLQDSLTKGFEMHVLGYIVHSILVKLLPTVEIGEVDYCLDQLLEVLENDIMGEVAEEKDVEAIAGKMKETKVMKSYESLKLLAEVVTFQTHTTALLGPVRRNLQKSLSPKLKPRIEAILNHIALGLLHNKSVTQTDLLVIVHAIIEDGVNEEKAVVNAAALKKQMKAEAMAGIKLVSSQVAKGPPPNFHLITEFALQLLNGHLKRVKINFHDAHTLGMLNPLLLLLQECLNSKYDGVLASALKSLSFLLLLPLPAIDNQGTELTVLIFSICQRFSRTESPLLVACISVLVILIRQCKTLRLSEEQLKSLLQLPIFVDMEEGSRMALSLLKAIIGRKLLVLEVYDMMNRVAQLMVTSHLAPVRQLCSQILLQFLLDYPLGQKRLQQHLDFFITNVGYVETSGREAALEMLHTIILKFPDSVVEEQADSMFFPLVTRLVNDESNQVRSMIGTILKVLMGRVGPQRLQRFVDSSFSWYKGADQRLWRPAAQVLGFIIEVMGTSFERFSQDILPQCLKILSLTLSSLDTKRTEVGETGHAQYWQEAYFSLTVMEKFFHTLPHLMLQPEYKEFWKLVCPLLLHQHLWIRKVCGRLLGMYFAHFGEPSGEDLRSAALQQSDLLFLHPSWLLLLVGSLCQELDAGVIDEAMGEQLVKILVDMSALLRSLPQDDTKPSDGKLYEGELLFLGCDDEDSKDRISRALILLGWGRKNRTRVDHPNGGSVNSEEANREQTMEDGAANKALSLVFSKLQKIALRVHSLQTKVIFRWYAAMASKLHVKEVECYLSSMLLPLYKLTEGSASKVVPEDVKNLGVEVLNQLREVLGATKFVNTYNAVRKSVKENRDKRKIAQKISVMVDPERNAKRKLHKSAKRQAQKKRKVIQAKRLQGL